MKRLLLGLGLGLTMFCGAACAQNDIQITGVVDMGLVREGGGPAGGLTKLTSGIASGSRLAFHGSEDLGGGNWAYFWLEQGLNADTGTLGQGGLAWGRQSFVGLRMASFGSISLGRQYTPAALVQVEMDPFHTGLAGDSANMLSPGGAGGSNRMNNAIKYDTPAHLGGFNAEVAYAPGETAGSTANREIGGYAGYAQGPLSVKVAYHDLHDASDVSRKVTWVASKYDFGVLTGYLDYVIDRGALVFGVPDRDARNLLVGLTAPIGRGQLMASYITRNDRSAANADAHQWAIGYDYFLSKRTDFYVSYAYIDNNAPIVAGVSGYRVGNATEQGSGNRAFTIGMRQQF